jgi:hypothetical protein
MGNERSGGLLAWQYRGYPEFHADRTSLVLHVVTVPVFQAGTLLLSAPLWGPWFLALGGVAMMAVAMAAQGRGHAREKNPPIPFAGPRDIVGRIFLEQWINFPRFVLSGGFARAWRGGT